jgi:hypothetical protein
MVDHAGVIGRRVRRCAEIVNVRQLDAVLGDMHLDISAHANPISREWEVRAEHDLKTEDLDIKVFRGLDIVGTYEVMAQVRDRHAALRSMNRRKCNDTGPRAQLDALASAW